MNKNKVLNIGTLGLYSVFQKSYTSTLRGQYKNNVRNSFRINAVNAKEKLVNNNIKLFKMIRSGELKNTDLTFDEFLENNNIDKEEKHDFIKKRFLGFYAQLFLCAMLYLNVYTSMTTISLVLAFIFTLYTGLYFLSTMYMRYVLKNEKVVTFLQYLNL